MIVQIYEIQTPAEAEPCIELGVDRIGSVLLSEKDWKQPELKEVLRLSEGTKSKNSLIPLIREQDTLFKAMYYYRPHYVHFCESLTDGSGQRVDLTGHIRLQEAFREKFPEIGMIRSVPIPASPMQPGFPFLEIARDMAPVSDLFLIDTWMATEPVSGYIGITGRTAHRDMARELVRRSPIPVILAGGLSPDNVYDAVLTVLPAGADSCTHTNQMENSGKAVRFKKDFKKVQSFVQEARRAEKAITEKKRNIEAKLQERREALKDREAALPAHSVRPHQLMAIEDLEEEIAGLESELKHLDKALKV
jgi:phosphoribosylanthranilate isomerase